MCEVLFDCGFSECCFSCDVNECLWGCGRKEGFMIIGIVCALLVVLAILAIVRDIQRISYGGVGGDDVDDVDDDENGKGDDEKEDVEKIHDKTKATQPPSSSPPSDENEKMIPETMFPNRTTAITEILLKNEAVFDMKSFETPNSPQKRALKWIALDDEYQVPIHDTKHLIQRFVLAVLYFSTNGDNWSRLSFDLEDGNTFLSPTHECDWWKRNFVGRSDSTGVRWCSDDYEVTSLVLSDSNLQGNLPAELSKLDQLEYLAMSRNELDGSLPSQMGELSNLEGISLHSNQLEGRFPSEWGNLISLNRVWINNNYLNGSIPENVCNDLGPFGAFEIDCEVLCDCCTKCF